MTVTFHEAARVDLADAVAYYDEQSPGQGSVFALEVHSVISRIIEHPEAGFPVRPSIRRIVLPRSPYSLLYSLSGPRLRVLAVMHHRRHPGYWQDRL